MANHEHVRVLLKLLQKELGGARKKKKAPKPAAPKPRLPRARVFDKGGVLKPGLNVVRNNLGRDERLVPASRVTTARRNATARAASQIAEPKPTLTSVQARPQPGA